MAKYVHLSRSTAERILSLLKLERERLLDLRVDSVSDDRTGKVIPGRQAILTTKINLLELDIKDLADSIRFAWRGL